jgi:mannitol/fructose-specific phosphotransferase system IIA component (Ntr-type)
MNLASILDIDDVVFGIRAVDIADAAAQLLRRTLPRRGFAAAEVDRLVDAVITREHQSPTLCGPIAIPHARDARLTSVVAAVGVNPEGVIAGSQAPRIVITFLSPEERRSEHLELLSSIARLSRDQAAIDAVATATTPQAVLEILAAHQK